MTARVNELTQFVDSAGAPLVNGSIYIGAQNSDPVLNPITIFSDRELTVPISNPQVTDSLGRAVTKIYIPGNYSIQIDDSLGVQQSIDLDAGLPENLSQTILINVIGADTITADTDPPISALVDNSLYMFTAVGPNSGPVTLNIEGLGARDLVKNFDDPLESADFETNQSVVVVYNATLDEFQWLGQKIDQEALAPLGIVQGFVGVAPPTGWILLDGGTIGNPASGATNRANNDTLDLFTLFWDNIADGQAPVSGGRGASAAADFAANKNLTVSNLMSGAALVGTGGVDPALHGNAGGLETITLVEAEMPSHDHTQTLNTLSPRSGGGITGGGQIVIAITGATGGDGSHNNMPPWVSLSWICKL